MHALGQVQRGSGEGSEGSGEGLRGFCVEPRHVKQGSGQGSGRFRGRSWEALVQSRERFNRVPEKVPEKAPGRLGAKPSQVQ